MKYVMLEIDLSNLIFVIWVIGFPLGCSIQTYLSERDYSAKTNGISAIIDIIIWVIVACLLFEGG